MGGMIVLATLAKVFPPPVGSLAREPFNGGFFPHLFQASTNSGTAFPIAVHEQLNPQHLCFGSPISFGGVASGADLQLCICSWGISGSSFTSSPNPLSLFRRGWA